MQATPPLHPSVRPYTKPKPPKRSYAKLVVFLLLAIVVAAPFVVDQYGVRRVQAARDYPAKDPLSADLKKRVERLASPELGGRKPGTEGNAAAALYVADALRDAGFEPLPSLGGYLAPLVDPVHRVPTRLGHNVIGHLPATEPPPEEGPTPWIVLGAHFDHIGQTPEGLLLGADDNASSVAVMLATAAMLKAQPKRRYPLAMVFFNTEEPPYFATPNMGSFAFVQNPPAELGRPPNVRLAIVADLLGGIVWRHSADAIFACGAEKSDGLGELVDSIKEDGLEVKRLGIHMIENVPDQPPSAVSDYDAFRDRGSPFLFLSSGRTPHYHRKTDLPATLHYDRMARTARWLAKLVVAADASEAKWKVDPQLVNLAKDVETLLWFLEPATKPAESIPGTSPFTFLRIQADKERLQRMTDPTHAFNKSDELMIERAGFRLQCLLWSQTVCFTL